MKNQIGQFDTPEIIKQPKVAATEVVEEYIVSSEELAGEINIAEFVANSGSAKSIETKNIVENFYAKTDRVLNPNDPETAKKLEQLKAAKEDNVAFPLAQEKKTVNNLEKYDRIREETVTVHLREAVPIPPHAKVIFTTDTYRDYLKDPDKITKEVMESGRLAGNTFGIADRVFHFLRERRKKVDSNFVLETRNKRLTQKEWMKQRINAINTRIDIIDGKSPNQGASNPG